MDAIVNGIRKRWHLDHTQRRQIGLLNKFLADCRRDEQLQAHWADIPATFALDLARPYVSGLSESTGL